MDKSVIAAIRLGDGEFAVWFDNGISRCCSAEAFGLELFGPFSIAVRDDGAGVIVGNEFIESERLFELGKEFDLINDEKRRILSDLSTIRREAEFSQTRLGEAAGIRQSVISRIEGCDISPQINTLIKLLAPLGKTLAIVDIDKTRSV